MKIVMSWEECAADLRSMGDRGRLAAKHIEGLLARGEVPICGECVAELKAVHVHHVIEAFCSEGCAIKHVGPGSTDPQEVRA